jgi:small subunit ribosomal protein S11
VAKQDTHKGSGRRPVVKKKNARSVPSGIVHVKATFNNTIISITDPSGKVISWASAGKVNFSGSRKSSAFAATIAAQDAARNAQAYGLKEVEVFLKGAGAGRESAVRGLQSAGLAITIIKDRTPVPHNGCRPRKRRRA